MVVDAEMEIRLVFSHTVLFLKVFQCLALNRTDFNIDTILQAKRYPLEQNYRNDTRVCYNLCRQICVNFRISTLLHNETIAERLQGLTSEKHDVVIVDEVVDMSTSVYQGSVILLPSMPSQVMPNITSRYVQTLSRLKEFTTLQTAVRLFSSLKDYIVLYMKQMRSDVFIVFHDNHTGPHVGELLDDLTDQGVGNGVMVYSIPGQHDWAQWEHILISIHKLLFTKGIYGLILGVPDTVLYTLKIINTFDGRSNRSTNFRHLSHWLVLTEVHSPDIYLPVVDKLENVALVDIHISRQIIMGIPDVAERVYATVNTYFTSHSESHKCPCVQDLPEYIQNVFSRNPEKDSLTVWALTGVGNVSTFHQVPVLVQRYRLCDSLYPNKKYQWNRVHLVVSTKPWPGFVKKITNGNQTSYEGMCIEILKSMADALNFTYTIEEVPDGEWGSIVNGSWTGLVRQLQDRVIDIAAADLGIHSGRDTVMDYIYPSIKTEVIDILYRLHNDSDITLESLTTPLTPVALLIMASSVCAVTVLYVAVEHVDVVLKVRGEHRRLVIIFWKVVWYHIGSILSQGGSENPRSCSGRLLLASWWLFCVVFAAMYSATLTVSFCVQRTVVPFTSLNDMVYDSNYKWGMFNGSINILHFSTSSNPLYKTTYTKMMEFSQSDPTVLSKDMEKQLDKVINEKYAFISSRNSLNVMAQRAPKGVTLTTLGETLYPTSVTLGVPTDSPLLPEMELVMTNLKESGFLQHWIAKYWNQSRSNTPSFELGGNPLPLTKILNILCVIGFGVAVSITVLLCEVLLTVIRKRAKVKLKWPNDD